MTSPRITNVTDGRNISQRARYDEPMEDGRELPPREETPEEGEI